MRLMFPIMSLLLNASTIKGRIQQRPKRITSTGINRDTHRLLISHKAELGASAHTELAR